MCQFLSLSQHLPLNFFVNGNREGRETSQQSESLPLWTITEQTSKATTIRHVRCFSFNLTRIFVSKYTFIIEVMKLDLFLLSELKTTWMKTLFFLFTYYLSRIAGQKVPRASFKRVTLRIQKGRLGYSCLAASTYILPRVSG
jgi:hypothetical protein